MLWWPRTWRQLVQRFRLFKRDRWMDYLYNCVRDFVRHLTGYNWLGAIRFRWAFGGQVATTWVIYHTYLLSTRRFYVREDDPDERLQKRLKNWPRYLQNLLEAWGMRPRRNTSLFWRQRTFIFLIYLPSRLFHELKIMIVDHFNKTWGKRVYIEYSH